MSVVGAGDVERANGRLRLRPGDRLTPLARDRAAELGVEIEVAPAAAGPAHGRYGGVRPDGPPAGLAGPDVGGRPLAPASGRSPSAILLRRGAPQPGVGWHGGARTAGGGPTGGGGGGQAGEGGGPAGRAVVLGAGHVGTAAAGRLAEADAFEEVVLVDVVEGLAAGIALDLWHGAALHGFRTRVRGATTLRAAGPADVVVVTAGKPRAPGMSRTDLSATNAAIVGAVARDVAVHAPDAVLIVVSNPLDEMTDLAWRVSGLPPARVLGMAGLLDTARFRSLVALEPEVACPCHVEAVALGSHGEEMVVPLSQATVEGQPIRSVLDAGRLDAIVARTRDSGAEVVALLRSGSAYLTPGAAAARMALAVARDTGEVVPAAVRADGEYGIHGTYIGLPARLGRGGVLGIVELPLEPDELHALRAAAARIAERAGALAPA